MSDYRRERDAIRSIIDDSLYKFLSSVKACIAGGCITSIFTGQPIADVDIFFRSTQDYEKAIKYFRECEYRKFRGTRTICETNNAKTFSMSHNKNYCAVECTYGITYSRNSADEKNFIVQIVRDNVNCGEPEDIINRFDITACQAAFDFKTDTFVIGSRFLQDNARKRIVINPECKNVIGTFYRIQKYIDKGYTVSAREYIKLAFMLTNKKYKTYRDFVNDLKLCFQDPLIHHFYNKVRYPTGVRCEEDDSMLNIAFDPSIIVEWIEEFNVAGPHYPVKEGKDMSDTPNEDYSEPKIDDAGNVIESNNVFCNKDDDFLDKILSKSPAVAQQKHPSFRKPPIVGVPKKANNPQDLLDDDDDIDIGCIVSDTQPVAEKTPF